MIELSEVPDWIRINRFVEAFEAARQVEPDLDLGRFLPEPFDPVFAPTLLELIRVDMEYRWGKSACSVETYLHRYPFLHDYPQIIAQLHQDECRMQREQPLHSGDVTTSHFSIDNSLAFSLLPTKLKRDHTPGNAAGALCRRSTELAIGLHRDSTNDGFPTIGCNFLGFQLLGELGRGGFGRVYLARQGDLAGRHVVLKVARGIVDESQTLAQLQHTHIVPIHSARRVGDLESICMPYFGWFTLQHLFQGISNEQRLPTTLESLKASIQTQKEQAQNRLLENALPTLVRGSESEVPDPPCKIFPWQKDFVDAIQTASPHRFPAELQDRSYTEIIVWMGACLAGGLAHAHERGIYHLDLKPANVLLTDDGRPMLLDFNLAFRSTIPVCEQADRIGGTLPYMAPEQIEAFQTGSIKGLDGRTDIYGLGVILFQMLTGRLPYALPEGSDGLALARALQLRKSPPPRLRKWNHSVSPAVEAIVRRCLNPKPEKRYQTARALAEDLQRQFENRPLQHTREPSIAEQVLKWTRRHPRIMSGTTVALLAILALCLMGLAFITRGARLAQLEMEAKWRRFHEDFQTVRYLLHMPRPTREQREEGLRLSRSNLKNLGLSPEAGEMSIVSNTVPAEFSHFRHELGEQLYLLVRTEREVWRFNPSNRSAAPPIDRWISWNSAALACFGPRQHQPLALLKQRADLLELNGQMQQADELRAEIRSAPLTRSEDLFLKATDLLALGQFREAQALLQQLLMEDPQHLWGWIAQGYCLGELGKFEEEAASYSTAIALGPQYPWPYYLRGIARLKLRHNAQALKDFQAAIDRAPAWWEPWLSRSIAHHRQGQYASSAADLTRALELGGPKIRIYCIRARVWQEAGNNELAQQDLQLGLNSSPTDELSWVARGLARLPSDPKGALADFEEALVRNGRCQAALQNKAHVLAEVLHQPEQALPVLDQLVRLYPDYLPARGGKAVLLARLGRRDEAVAEVNECLMRQPDGEILFQLGAVFAQTSIHHPADAERAIELIGSALRLGWGYQVLDQDDDLAPLRGHPSFERLRQAASMLTQNQQQSNSKN